MRLHTKGQVPSGMWLMEDDNLKSIPACHLEDVDG
jgi:hypothetical protein